MTAKKISLMFLGAPGVGKGTYANRIAPKLKIPTISTGDLIRDEVKRGTKLGNTLNDYAKKGALVPDDFVISMVKDRIGMKDCERGYLLDGFPRTLAQAKKLTEDIEPLKLVINIMLKEEHLMAKILGRRVCPSCKKNFNVANIVDEKEGVAMPPLLPKHGDPTKCECGCALERREDDTEQVVRNRLTIYNRDTAPLIQYYEKLGTLRDFVVKRGLDDLPKLESLIEGELRKRKLLV